MTLDATELEQLRASAINCGGDARLLDIVVNACAYSCCGRGWRRRDGYEQSYRGWVDNLQLPDDLHDGSFMLYSPGIGTISYVVAVRFSEVEAIDYCQMRM